MLPFREPYGATWTPSLSLGTECPSQSLHTQTHSSSRVQFTSNLLWSLIYTAISEFSQQPISQSNIPCLEFSRTEMCFVLVDRAPKCQRWKGEMPRAVKSVGTLWIVTKLAISGVCSWGEYMKLKTRDISLWVAFSDSLTVWTVLVATNKYLHLCKPSLTSARM